MRRRRFIAAAVAATGAGLAPAALADAAMAAPDRLNGSTTLRTTLADLRADIWNTGADYVDPRSAPARADLLDVAQWQWAQAVTIANRARRTPTAIRAQALTLEAEASRQLAMIHADRTQYREALNLYRLATGAAIRANDFELLATIRTSHAYMPLYAGNLARTAELAHSALESLSRATRHGGRAAVCANALLARCYAAQGNAPAASAALRHAYGHMAHYEDAGSVNDPAPHHPERFAWVKLRLATAEAYAALGDERQHTQAHQAALADPSVSQMHRPMLAMGAAEVSHDPADAARQALNVLRGYDKPPNPIIGRARHLAARAADRAPRDETVQALRIHLITLPR